MTETNRPAETIMLTGQADDGWVGIYLQNSNVADPIPINFGTCFRIRILKAASDHKSKKTANSSKGLRE